MRNAIIICVVILVQCCFAAPLELTGVSLSCAEFGSAIPGVYNKDFTFPTPEEVEYFKSKGMTFVRFPFLWERLQPSLNGEFDTFYFSMANSFIKNTTQLGMKVLLDVHNYARYRGQVIGASSVTSSEFADLWKRLASEYKFNDLVIFGLMNEPNTMSTEVWLADANAAIAAIRATGAKNLITVPGNAWTSAAGWNLNWYGTSNGVVMKGVKDPANNFVFEVHQYLDSDASGTNPACVSSSIGQSRISDFTAWLKANNHKAILGEFGGGVNAVCRDAVTGMLSYMEQNRDVWLGWSWWAAGPWWGNYFTTLEPNNGQDAPQLSWLLPHI